MKTTRLALAFLALFVAVPACSGGGGGGGGGCPDLAAGGTLTSGEYDVSCWDQLVDECALLTSRNGETLSVAVTGTDLQIGLGSGTIVGSSLTLAAGAQVDFNDDPFGFGAVDCVVDQSQLLAGMVKGNDVADVVETYDVVEVSGAECVDAEEGVSNLAGANISFPCHSEAEFRFTKSGT